MLQLAPRVLIIAAAGAISGLGLVASGVTTGADRLLASSYAHDASYAETTWARVDIAPQPKLWLSHAPASSRTLRRAVSAGERITIGFDAYRIVAIEEADEDVGRTPLRLQLVTAEPEGVPGEPVKFLFAIERSADEPKREKLL